MSVEGDKKNYARSMVEHAFCRMYDKEVNAYGNTEAHHGLEISAQARETDDKRILTMVVYINK